MLRSVFPICARAPPASIEAWQAARSARSRGGLAAVPGAVARGARHAARRADSAESHAGRPDELSGGTQNMTESTDAKRADVR